MNVLAYIDSSPYALSICQYAAWVATRLNIPIELIHVIEKGPDDSVSPADLSGRLGIDSRAELMRELVALDWQRNKLKMESGRYLLEDAAGRVRSAGVAEVTTRLVHGALVDHLKDHEEEARVLIVGKRGEGAHAAEGHLGTNLERVIRASNRPIL